MKQITVLQKYNFADVKSVNDQIVEFIEKYSIYDFKNRVKGNDPLILVAYIDKTPVGYTLGYDRHNDGSFYSWMGGVVPKYRKLGVYSKLRKTQEEWVKQNSKYKSIKIKTRNRRVPMRIFLAKNGYNLISVKEKDDVLDYGLMHEKKI